MQRALNVSTTRLGHPLQIDLHDFYDYENDTFMQVSYQQVIDDLIDWGLDEDTIKILKNKDMIHIQEYGSIIPTSILEEDEVNLANKVVQTLA
jgi:hypothetical protein